MPPPLRIPPPQNRPYLQANGNGKGNGQGTHAEFHESYVGATSKSMPVAPAKGKGMGKGKGAVGHLENLVRIYGHFRDAYVHDALMNGQPSTTHSESAIVA